MALHCIGELKTILGLYYSIFFINDLAVRVDRMIYEIGKCENWKTERWSERSMVFSRGRHYIPDPIPRKGKSLRTINVGNSTANSEMESRSSGRKVVIQQGGWYNSNNPSCSLNSNLMNRVSQVGSCGAVLLKAMRFWWQLAHLTLDLESQLMPYSKPSWANFRKGNPVSRLRQS